MSRSLYERARKGNHAAVSTVVTLLRPRVARMAAHYASRSGESADDLEQEGWIALLQALKEVDVTIGSPEQFLLKHARWQVLDAIKRANVRRCVSLDDTLAEAALPPVPASQPEGDVALGQFVHILPPSHQAVVAQLVRGHTWREAGEALGCTSANIAYYVRQIRIRYEAWCTEGL